MIALIISELIYEEDYSFINFFVEKHIFVNHVLYVRGSMPYGANYTSDKYVRLSC